MRGNGVKAGVAGFLVTLAMVLPMLVFGAPNPAIYVSGARVKVHSDGSVQLLFDVTASDVENLDSAFLTLDYDARYLTPSDYVSNALLTTNGAEDGFFRPHQDLFFDTQNPFQPKPWSPLTGAAMEYSMLFASSRQIWLSLAFRNVPDGYDESANPGILTAIPVGEGEEDEVGWFVADSAGKQVILGTLSFRAEPEYLSELAARCKAGWTGLITIQKRDDSPTIGYYQRVLQPWGVSYWHNTYKGAQVATLYSFHFPPTAVAVRLAQPEVTVTAYEAYGDGTADDIVRTMQKNSPMVIVTYLDGSESTAVLPWGRTGPEDGFQLTGAADPYDPTQGVYTLRQHYVGPDGQAFPVPVNGSLTVTPVTLVGVTADNLVKTYRVPNANPQASVLAGITSPDLLDLPARARLLTDVSHGASSLTLDIEGWTPKQSGSIWPGTGGTANNAMERLLADNGAGGTPHWPSAVEMSGNAYQPADYIGTYSFFHSTGYGSPLHSGFSKAQIQSVYPWLTVPQAVYTLSDARRVLVGEGGVIDTERYTVEWRQTATVGGNPEMTLVVGRREQSGSNYETMNPGSHFRVRLPDGTEIGTADTAVTGGAPDDWFAGSDDNKSKYSAGRVEVDGYGRMGYALTFNPGVTSGTGAGAYAAQRELLRRYINLGGWFYVSVNEDTDAYAWTDYIPVYVPPRQNFHTESKTYLLLGPNSDLISWPAWPGRTFTVPAGSYRVVNNLGQPLYLQPAESGDGTLEPTTDSERRDEISGDLVANPPMTERFGVSTTYHGETGAEPGLLHTFAVESVASWPSGPTAGIYTYGPAPFVDGTAVYSGYGRVSNPPDPTEAERKTVEIRRQAAPDPAQDDEGLVLRYYGERSGVSKSGEDVTRVTYNTMRERYTVREEFTLTIENHGTTDVYDLRVDTQAFAAARGGVGSYEVIKAPASFLPAGGSTTFTLTYRYDLTGNGNAARDYLETLYVTSSSRAQAAPGNPSTYWIAFDAQFRVTPNTLHTVYVSTSPAGMGEAGVILGETEDLPNPPWMNYEPGSSTFESGRTVYILVRPYDEYAIDTAQTTFTDRSGANVSYNEYWGSAVLLDDGSTLYCFEMPAYDVMVNIVFYEPNRSKLRLGDLRVYSGLRQSDWDGPSAQPPAPGITYLNSIWQKFFTSSEQSAAIAWEGESGANQRREYLMMVGRARTRGFFSSAEQYITVLKNDQEHAQVEVDLRELEILTGENLPISPYVQMFLFTEPPVSGTPYVGRMIFDGTNPSQPGNTDPLHPPPSTFTSDIFLAPEPGKSVYVRVDVFVSGNTRSYYLEIHRSPKEVVATLQYGNSPAGMIMNDMVMSAAQKTESLNAFKRNNYTFAGMTGALVPARVVSHPAVWDARYWTEAWVPVGSIYEPESFLGTGPTDEENLDLNPYVFFAILGQEMLDPGLRSAQDSSGRNLTAAALAAVDCTVTVKLLNTTPDATQTERFIGAVDAANPPDRIPLAEMRLELGKAGSLSSVWKAGGSPPPILPGEYELVYSFPDYDGETMLEVTRRLFILGPPGDVNGDGMVNAADTAYIQNRVSHPLGFAASGYGFGNVYRYRSADANNDRNINNIDADQIDAVLAGKAQVTFYLPTGYK